MNLPKLTVTMLGTTRSGKSTYLLGMYATMSAGVRNYFAFTEDPDQDLDLSDAWELLNDTGQLPPPNDIDQSVWYSFQFKHGLDTLLGVDWMDYRGGAMKDRSDSAADVGELHERLGRSDSIYLVLNGESIGDWIAGTVPTPKIQRDLLLPRMSTMVQRAVDNRKAAGLPPPSLVLLITKADLVGEKNDGDLPGALAEAVKRLKELLQVAYQEGVTALICPVQIGVFGPSSGNQVNVEDIEPVGLHRPILFSFLHYLTEGVGAHRDELRRMEESKDGAYAELNSLRNGFMGGLFRAGRIRAAQDQVDRAGSSIADLERQIGRTDAQLELLAAELAGQPILRDGRLVL